MKKIIMIVGALLLSAGCLKAQDPPPQDTTTRGYRSFFGSESTVWYDAVEVMDVGYVTHRLVVGDDTVLGETTYKKLHDYVINTYDSTDVTGGLDEDDYRHIIVREDTSFGRLWWRQDGMDEVLLVDMSLNIGDTFGEYGVIRTVYYDSIGRKCIELYNGVCLVEGAPFTTGMFHYPDVIACVFQDGVKTYTGARIRTNEFDLDRCRGRVPSNNGITLADEKMMIYPNPCRDQLKIEVDKVKWIQLYDMYGYLVMCKRLNVGINEIEIRGIATGIYILRFVMNEKIYNKRLIIE